MTDYEISRKLALAIGWSENDIASFDGHRISVYIGNHLERAAFGPWRVFDYRNSSVIWPIAEKYGAFPENWGSSWRALCWNASKGMYSFSDEEPTAAKAVAMAVIGAGERGS